MRSVQMTQLLTFTLSVSTCLPLSSFYLLSVIILDLVGNAFTVSLRAPPPSSSVARGSGTCGSWQLWNTSSPLSSAPEPPGESITFRSGCCVLQD